MTEPAPTDAPTDAPAGPSPVKVALVEAPLVALVDVLLLTAIALALDGFAGGWVGPRDVQFAALVGLSGLPAALVEAALRRPAAGLAGDAARAALVGLVAGLGLVLAPAFVVYALVALAGLPIEQPLQAAATSLGRFADLWGDARPVLVAGALPFAGIAFARARDMPLAAQAALAALLTLVGLAASLAGFDGLPQPRWLLGAGGLGPVVVPFCYARALTLPVALPLARRSAIGLLAHLGRARPD